MGNFFQETSAIASQAKDKLLERGEKLEVITYAAEFSSSFDLTCCEAV